MFLDIAAKIVLKTRLKLDLIHHKKLNICYQEKKLQLKTSKNRFHFAGFITFSYQFIYYYTYRPPLQYIISYIFKCLLFTLALTWIKLYLVPYHSYQNAKNKIFALLPLLKQISRLHQKNTFFRNGRYIGDPITVQEIG